MLRPSILLVAALALSLGTSACAMDADSSDDDAIVDDTAAPADEADAPPVAWIEPMDAATYEVRLRDLEARVDELKEQIRSSHARVGVLRQFVAAPPLDAPTLVEAVPAAEPEAEPR